MTTGTGDRRVEHAIAAGEERVRHIETSTSYLLGQSLVRLRPTPASVVRFLTQLRELRSHHRQRTNVDRVDVPWKVLPPLDIDGSAQLRSELSTYCASGDVVARVRITAEPGWEIEQTEPVPTLRWDLRDPETGTFLPHIPSQPSSRKGVLQVGPEMPLSVPPFQERLVTALYIGGDSGRDLAAASRAAGTPVVMAIAMDQDGVVSAQSRDVSRVARRVSRRELDVARLRVESRRWAQRTNHNRIAVLGRLLEEATDWKAPASPTVAVVCATRRPCQLRHVVNSVKNQEGVDFRFVLVCHGDGFDRTEVEELVDDAGGTAVYAAPDLSLGECLDLGRAKADARVIAKFDDDDHYGPWYLRDSIDTMTRTGAAVVGKQSYFVHLVEQDATYLRFPGLTSGWARRVAGCTLVFDQELVGEISFPVVSRGEDTLFVERCRQQGLGVYADEPFGFIQSRRSTGHTWQITDDEIIPTALKFGDGLTDEVLLR